MKKSHWPELSYPAAKETYHTIHLWTQIAGKIKLANRPWINHSWHVTLVVTPFGLTTGAIPGDEKHFQINFNFLKHQLQLCSSEQEEQVFELRTLTITTCYQHILNTLAKWGLAVEINPVPNEIEHAIPFSVEQAYRYDPAAAASLHRALLHAQKVFFRFRAEFIGKCSPVHFFWGGFDLAVTRFSGRRAPAHPGGVPNLPDWVAREAYSHEVSSAGFWPGDDRLPFAAFYSYSYPEPEGFKKVAVKPESAFYHPELGEFILPYEAVRQADDPSKALMEFLHSTYAAAARLGNWNRQDLER